MEPQPDETLLDHNMLLNLASLSDEDEPDFLGTTFSLFRTDMAEALREMRALALAADAKTLRSWAHKAKGMSLNVGASALAAHLLKLEQDSGTNRNPPNWPQLVEESGILFERTCQAVDKWRVTHLN
jgi:HPt (histidine-containing phosphotransfer) domain-containing protein